MGGEDTTVYLYDVARKKKGIVIVNKLQVSFTIFSWGEVADRHDFFGLFGPNSRKMSILVKSDFNVFSSFLALRAD